MAKWIETQYRTFTNWFNLQLAKPIAETEDRVEKLEEDLRDGTLLICCLEGCIDKKYPRKKKVHPKSKIMQLENLSGAFDFMADHGVKLINIGPGDVNDGHKKLILGMIWSIIANFQISTKLGEKGSAKDQLLEWLNSKITSCTVTNFKDDWADGKLLRELTNKIGEEIYEDGTILLPDEGTSASSNAQAAMDIAEEMLCVGKLVSVEDFLGGDSADEHSNMTYLALFKDASKPQPKEATGADEPEPVAAAVPEPEPEAEPEPEPEPEPDTTSTKLPPWERPPDWRTYEGIDLGGRCKIKVFYSTTTHDVMIRKNTEALMKLLEALQVHKRPDFEPWTPLDMDMDREFRNKIFEKAGTRVSPFLFVDDEYIGGYDQVKELNDIGEFKKILDY